MSAPLVQNQWRTNGAKFVRRCCPAPIGKINGAKRAPLVIFQRRNVGAPAVALRPRRRRAGVVAGSAELL